MVISSKGIKMKSKDYFGYTIFEDGTVLGKNLTEMSPALNHRGYLIIRIMLDGNRKTKAIHRLVAECFVANPENLKEVNHKDGNKLNNHYTNLEWCTRGANIKHAYTLNLRSATGVNNARCIITEKDVKAICSLLQEGWSASEIRDKGFNYNIVRAIKARKNWKHISKDYLF